MVNTSFMTDDMFDESVDEGQFFFEELPLHIIEICENFATSHLVIENKAEVVFKSYHKDLGIQDCVFVSVHLERYVHPTYIYNYHVLVSLSINFSD